MKNAVEAARTAVLRSPSLHIIAEWLHAKCDPTTHEVTFTIASLSRALGYSRETIRTSLKHMHALQLVRLPNGPKGGVAMIHPPLKSMVDAARRLHEAKQRLISELSALGGAP